MLEGIRTLHSRHSVDETLSRLESMLAEKKIKLFTIVDHSGEANAIGLHMPTTKLILFGNPAAGTPLMISAPSLALDLPLKMLLSQEPNGSTEISWNDPAYLQSRHGFAESLVPKLAVVESLARALADQDAPTSINA